jgi:hypothetical protein
LAFYESFDSLIRDNIERAGALMREAATRQVDAEAKLRSTTKDFERRQIEERSGYRSVFGALLDDVAAIQQQVERLATRVSDALDDLELQLPAAGELSAIERGQAPGMTGLAAATVPPAGLPSGASHAAWVAHDEGLEHPTTNPAQSTSGSTRPGDDPRAGGRADANETEAASERVEDRQAADASEPGDEPLTTDDMDIVSVATGEVDPDIVVDVLTEYTDADPAVAESPEDRPTGTVQPTDLSNLPEEFGLDNSSAPGAAGVVDEPYVEQSEATELGYSEPPTADGDLSDEGGSTGDGPSTASAEGDQATDTVELAAEHLTTAGGTEGFYVDSSPELDRLMDEAVGGTPLLAAAPDVITEVDGGLETSADGGDLGWTVDAAPRRRIRVRRPFRLSAPPWADNHETTRPGLFDCA